MCGRVGGWCSIVGSPRQRLDEWNFDETRWQMKHRPHAIEVRGGDGRQAMAWMAGDAGRPEAVSGGCGGTMGERLTTKQIWREAQSGQGGLAGSRGWRVLPAAVTVLTRDCTHGCRCCSSGIVPTTAPSSASRSRGELGPGARLCCGRFPNQNTPCSRPSPGLVLDEPWFDNSTASPRQSQADAGMLCNVTKPQTINTQKLRRHVRHETD